MLLFSYGSNNPDQLASRLGRRVKTDGAYVSGYERVFCGNSQRWGGGVASLREAPGKLTYGLIATVTADDLATMDVVEGVYAGSYERIAITVHDKNGTPKKAFAYVSLKSTFTPPTRAYLESIAKTIGTHWKNDDGSKVTWQDVVIRKCGG